MPTYWLSDSQSASTQKPLKKTPKPQPALPKKKKNNANPSQPLAEIGVAFCSGGGFFFLLGLILFFDRALLAMGNILFLVGITLLLGPQRTFVFFARKQKWKGTLAFWAGVLLILMKWPLVGFGVELFGIFVLFGVSLLACLVGGGGAYIGKRDVWFGELETGLEHSGR